MSENQVKSLREGRISLKDQAAQRGCDVPVGKTVQELVALGYDVDETWGPYWTLKIDARSPTGYVVGPEFSVADGTAAYALAH